MKELSIFIDESGDFGIAKEKTAYYLVTFVFHNQKHSIVDAVKKIEESIRNSGFNFEYIHTGPVIRREGVFSVLSIDDRRKLIYKMLNFMLNCDIRHSTVVVNKKGIQNKDDLSCKIESEIIEIVKKHIGYFKKYDRIIVYYDNGQVELSSIINKVFSTYFVKVEFRKVEPQKYRLLQVADFVCSFELLRIKWNEKRLSKSEEKFFYKTKELKKVFFKAIDKKRLE